MPFEPTERVPVGSSGVTVTQLGFGCAPIGGLFRAVTDADAADVLDRAWALGIRYFDVAPLYGYGAAERRLGRALQGRPRDGFAVSTKVGRLVRTADTIGPGADVDRQAWGGRPDAFYADVGDRRMVFDYSGDGVRRSIEESLERLGLDRIDIVFIHDPDEHWQVALEEAYPALHRLRETGVVGAIGVGMNQSAMLARFADATDPDVFLLAGRYTLFDQDALTTLLPACEERGIAVLVGGVMNSGLLADPRAGDPPGLRPRRRPGRRPRPPARRGLRAARRLAPGGRDAVPARASGGARVDRRGPSGGAPRGVPGVPPAGHPAGPVGGPPRRGMAVAGCAGTGMTSVIDAHHHLLDPSHFDYPWLGSGLEALDRRFGPEDLAPDLAHAGVDATILVQTISSLDETRAFLRTALATPWIAGVIGWADLTDPGLASVDRRPARRPGRRSPRGHPPSGPRRTRIRTGWAGPTWIAASRSSRTRT